MSTIIDLRNLPCPMPVLKVKEEFLNKPDLNCLTVLVSDEINVNNLNRFAISQNLNFQSELKDDIYKIILTKPDYSLRPDDETDLRTANKNITTMFIDSNTLGNGDKDFSEHLFDVFLQSLVLAQVKPDSILLINKGVLLLANDTTTKISLFDLARQNTEILACGLCLDYYNIKDNVSPSFITNMTVIVDKLMQATKVIKL